MVIKKLLNIVSINENHFLVTLDRGINAQCANLSTERKTLLLPSIEGQRRLVS